MMIKGTRMKILINAKEESPGPEIVSLVFLLPSPAGDNTPDRIEQDLKNKVMVSALA